MSFGRHLPPGVLGRFVDDHRARHAARLAHYEAMVAGAGPDADPYTMATLDFGVRYERAVLEWFEALPPEITAGPTATVGERTRR